MVIIHTKQEESQESGLLYRQNMSSVKIGYCADKT